MLVRYAEVWLPRVLGRGRRGVIALAYGDGPSASVFPPSPASTPAPTPTPTPAAAAAAAAAAAEAVLGVVAEHADRLRGRQLSLLVLVDGTEELPARLGAVEATLPPEVAVHLVPGGPARLPVALKAVGAARAPLLAYVDGSGAADPAVLAATVSGHPAEVLLVTDAAVHTGPNASPRPARDAAVPPPPTGGAGASLRAVLTGAGFPLVAEVDLVPTDGSPARRLAFGTGYDRSLEAFKDLLWAVDEHAGARYRDPADPAGRLLDIALDPEPGPLRRELLAELVRSGSRTVTELRRHALTATVYRSADVPRALTGLLQAGAVSRDPEHGRLGGDVVIAAASPGPA
ncbi:hypothetical protein QTQ03_30125 [Micromonospora sp. WMMA1363]|uniref:hypothetical protein n=1 Tax=Micromonospora sp. WMMA1363 TaxID=3053985 RepID=UPI00259C91B5|nr:hypothetical protein [Micromonospora sp. WMMA1363]MDM4718229.1 hypothetical protein [Micromonospora sp. WMMA1363]MDM4723611.1 hypothetical protein [Micromonospora sp. WMMA1363]